MNHAANLHADSQFLRALSLAPFVAVAWAEPGPGAGERSLVMSWAGEIGLRTPDPGHRLLEHWLTERPDFELIDSWKRHYADRLSRSLSHEARREFKRHVMRRAQTVLGAASGRPAGVASSPEEQAVIAKIEAALC